ncbi:hypothetical protein JCM11641_002291 [Rhodosporidiobolus odoratus]
MRLELSAVFPGHGDILLSNSADHSGEFPDKAAGKTEPYLGRKHDIDWQAWMKAAAESEGRYDPSAPRAYRLVFSMKQRQPEATVQAAVSDCASLAQRIAGLNLEHLPHNVRLFLPRAHQGGAELRAKANMLSRSSPYLKDLLVSNFAESTPRRLRRARASAEATGFIRFTPLSSSFPLAESPSTRNDWLTAKVAEDSSLPLPISPKSAYRVAHLLQLEDLQKKSLEAVRSSLTVAYAATEISGDTSITYEEFRQVSLEFTETPTNKHLN